MKNVRINFSILIIIAVLFSSCSGWNNTTKGGAIGAGSGAVVGGVVGRVAGNTAAGAIIGAAVGGTAGALIGRRMDKQAEELRRDLEGANVERIGEGIKITFDAGILYPVNSAELQAGAKTDISQLAETLKKYPDTEILIEGHTDNTGNRSINQPLSERRAQSVANYLSGLGVDRSRMTTTGYADDQPIADNSTASGREQNRRVEIAIFANEKMKKAAERGQL